MSELAMSAGEMPVRTGRGGSGLRPHRRRRPRRRCVGLGCVIATGGRHRPWSGGLGRFSLLLSTSLPWLFEPMSSITPQSARARIGQRTWASVAEQVKPARMMPTSPPSCKCTTRRYAFGRLRAVLCSSVWTPRSSVATLRAAIPRHPGLRLAQRGQDLTPSWRARPLQRSRTQLQLHGSVLLQVCGAPDWLREHGTDHHARARGLAGPAAQDP